MVPFKVILRNPPVGSQWGASVGSFWKHSWIVSSDLFIGLLNHSWYLRTEGDPTTQVLTVIPSENTAYLVSLSAYSNQNHVAFWVPP